MSEILFSIFIGLWCVWLVTDIITKVRSWLRPGPPMQEHGHYHYGHVKVNTPGRFG
jgi:hypothetical protein